MNKKTETFNINKVTAEKLGLKIILASDTKTNYIFAIITEINPASFCNSVNIEVGDILYSINGVEINTSDSLNDMIESVLNETSLVLTVMKKGALDGSDLIKRCMGSPCTEFCEIWNEATVKLKKRFDTVDRTIPLESRTATFKCFKSSNVDNANIRKTSNGSVEDTLLSSKATSYNNSKVKFHQKAIPMGKSKKSSNNGPTAHIIHKSARTPTSDMIASPQPHFINRPSARKYISKDSPSQLTHAKSFTKIHSNQSSDTLSTSSSSTSTSLNKNPSNKIKEQIILKPLPMPRKNANNLSHQKSLEIQDFSSLKILKTTPDRLFRPPIITSKPNYSAQTLNKLNNELKGIFHQNSLTSQDAPVLPNRSPKRGAFI